MVSRVYAKTARRRGDEIRFMRFLDGLGGYRDDPGSQRHPRLFRRFYPERANFIVLVSNLHSRRRMRRRAAAFLG